MSRFVVRTMVHIPLFVEPPTLCFHSGKSRIEVSRAVHSTLRWPGIYTLLASRLVFCGISILSTQGKFVEDYFLFIVVVSRDSE